MPGLDHHKGQDDAKVNAKDRWHPAPEEVQVGIRQLDHGVERLPIGIDVGKPHDGNPQDQHSLIEKTLNEKKAPSHVDLAEVQRAQAEHELRATCLRETFKGARKHPFWRRPAKTTLWHNKNLYCNNTLKET